FGRDMKIVVVGFGLMAGAGLTAVLSGVLSRPASAQAEAGAVVAVVRATTGCFSDMVRVAGYLVPRRMAVVNVESEGYKLIEVMVGEGDQVTSGQVLACLNRESAGGQQGQAGGGGRATPASLTLRAPAAGLVTRSTA